MPLIVLFFIVQAAFVIHPVKTGRTPNGSGLSSCHHFFYFTLFLKQYNQHHQAENLLRELICKASDCGRHDNDLDKDHIKQASQELSHFQ